MSDSTMACITSLKKLDAILINPFNDFISVFVKEIRSTREMHATAVANKKMKARGIEISAAQNLTISMIEEYARLIVHYERIVVVLNAKKKDYETKLKDHGFVELMEKPEDKEEKAHILMLDTIREVLLHKELLFHLTRPIVRQSFVEGEHGAPVLTDEEFAAIDDLEKIFNPSSEGCRDNGEFKKRIMDAANEIMKLLKEEEGEQNVKANGVDQENDNEDRVEGDQEANGDKKEIHRRSLLHSISSCEYFETLKMNSASKKEKKDKKKEEKKSDDTNGLKTPPVTFLRPEDIVPPLDSISFGYDTQLKHPDEIIFNAFLAQSLKYPPGLTIPRSEQQPQQMHQPPPDPQIMMGPPTHLGQMPMQHSMGPTQYNNPQMPMQQNMQPYPLMQMPQFPPHMMQQQQQVHHSQSINTFVNNGQRDAWEATAVAGVARPGGLNISPDGSNRASGSGLHNDVRANGGIRAYETRRPPLCNTPVHTSPIMHPPPAFGFNFDLRMPFPGNGFHHHPPPHNHQRYPMNGFHNGMGGIGMNGIPPMGMPSGALYLPPNSTYPHPPPNTPCGLPNGLFRRSPPRNSNGNHRGGRQNRSGKH